MPSITLILAGAKAHAIVDGPLTAGMVGIPVTIECDDTWNGLTKNLVCRCGQWGPGQGETRTVLDVGKTATVAHEVMKADKNLYLGLEGFSADGELVMPSTWADCGKIQHSADAESDPSSKPMLSFRTQLQTEIKKLKQNVWTEKQIIDVIEAYLDENAIEPPDSSHSGNGLTTEQVETLHDMFKVCAFTKADVSAEYAAFKTAFGISDSVDGEETVVTLTVISATYSGGAVPAGTSASSLSGIVVTACYSDGTSKTVTDYTLSGTIAEGENTITVSYGGKTATFTVTGVAEQGGTPETNIDIPSENLMGYYDMRTALTEDNYITDLSGNGRDILFYPANGYYENGTLYRGDKASQWVNEDPAYAITDGAKQKYSYGDSITLFVTISGYTTPADPGATPLISTGIYRKEIITFQGGVIVYHQNAGFNNVASDTQITSEELTTICAVITPTEEKIYLNGILKNTSTAKGGAFGTALNLLCGYSSGSDADTKIHNAAVYNAALRDEDVAAISATLFTNAGGEA